MNSPRRRHAVRECRRCGRGPIATGGRIRRQGLRGHYRSSCRGLCEPCRHLSERDGSIGDYPRMTQPLADTAEDYKILRARYPHLKRAELADKLDMSDDALEQAIYRARRQGLLPPVTQTGWGRWELAG